MIPFFGPIIKIGKGTTACDVKVFFNEGQWDIDQAIAEPDLVINPLVIQVKPRPKKPEIPYCGISKINILDLVLLNAPNTVQSVKEAGKLGNSAHAVIKVLIQVQSTVHIPKHVVWNFAKAKFQDMKNEFDSLASTF